MGFTFIHTADWQIGKTFGRFEADKAAILRHARLAVIDRIAETARAANAEHVLVAGDVFDGETLPDKLVQQTLARLSAQRGVIWHLLPGNHDPARPGGIWERLAGIGVPVNVQLHLTAAPAEIATGVHLLPAPLASKSTSSDPTAWMDAAATPEHALRIGVAHGSIRGFGSLGEAAVPIDPNRPNSAGLAYLALGDWHGMKAIGPALWYSGTPEPDSFVQNDPGHVLAVRIDGMQSPPHVQAIATAEYRWLDRHISLDGTLALDKIEAEITTLGAAAAKHLLDLTLQGRMPISRMPDVDQRLARLAALLFDLRLDRRALTTTTADADLADIGDPALAAVAARLKARTEAGPASEQRIASLALERLMGLAAGADQGQST